MARGGSPSAHSEKVLIIMSNSHAAEVRLTIEAHSELSRGAAESEKRFHRVMIAAFQKIWNKPDGWYDAEFRAELARTVKPRLTRTESERVMQEVYAVIPPRVEDAAIKNMRQLRRDKLELKK